MRETLKRLAKLTAGYSLVTLIGPLFTILLTPLYTRVLTPADYGVYEAAIAFSAITNIIVMMGFDLALTAMFFRGDERYQRNLVTTALVLIISFGTVGAVLLIALAEPIASFLYNDPSLAPIVYLIAANAIFQPIYALSAATLKLRMGIRRVNALGLTFLLATIVSNVLLVLVLQMKAPGIVAANVLAGFVGAVTGILLLWRPLRGQFTPSLVRPLMTAGLGLLPGTLSFLILSVIDRIMLTQFVSQTDLGLYSIANKITSMVYVLISAAWTAWWPLAMEMADKPDAPRQYARMLEYFVCGAMLLGLTIGLFAPEILAVFTREAYVPAAPYVLGLMIYSGPLGMLTSSLAVSVYARKQLHWVSVAYIAAAATNIVLNLILCPLYGVWGAVIATVLAGALLSGLMFIFGRRLLFIPARFGRLAIVGAVYLLFTIVVIVLPSFPSIAIRLLAIAALAGAILFAGIVDRKQLALGVQAIQQVRLSKQQVASND
jgi:O-antigen/teichoic acid export membrane protein